MNEHPNPWGRWILMAPLCAYVILTIVLRYFMDWERRQWVYWIALGLAASGTYALSLRYPQQAVSRLRLTLGLLAVVIMLSVAAVMMFVPQ